jgi:hypothetical protein
MARANKTMWVDANWTPSKLDVVSSGSQATTDTGNNRCSRTQGWITSQEADTVAAIFSVAVVAVFGSTTSRSVVIYNPQNETNNFEQLPFHNA